VQNLTPAHWLVIASGLITTLGAAGYIRAMVAGRTKPNRVSWLMWALAPLIGTGAAISAGADLWATVRIFLGGLLPLIVLIASLWCPQSYWQTTRFDRLCGWLSGLALLTWVAAASPRAAILLAVAADTFASIPTIVKAWRYPGTESGVAYLTGLLGALLVIPSITTWNIENSAFQIYLILVNIVLVIAVYRPR